MHSYLYSIEEVNRTLEDFLAGDTEEDKRIRREKDQFHYIPMQLEPFFEQLDTALKLSSSLRADHRFIDAGCGIGSKVLAAKQLGSMIVEGVEIEKKYVDVARKLMASRFGLQRNGHESWAIHHGDAITFDYSPYDIIYFWNPLSDPKLEAKMEKRIMATAKPGALVLVNGQSRLWARDKQWKAIWNNQIFQKQGTVRRRRT